MTILFIVEFFKYNMIKAAFTLFTQHQHTFISSFLLNCVGIKRSKLYSTHVLV